ncbi:unnamed protein product, partial [Meganyctiphanes norvegica]
KSFTSENALQNEVKSGGKQHDGKVNYPKVNKIKSKTKKTKKKNIQHRHEKKLTKQEKIYPKMCRPSWHKVDIRHHIMSLPSDSPLKFIIDNNIQITPQVLFIKECGTCNFKCTDLNGRKTDDVCTPMKQKEKTYILYQCQDGNKECSTEQREYVEIKLMEDKKCKCQNVIGNG